VQRQGADRTLAPTRGIAKIRNPHGHRSDVIVTPRPNGGVTIKQGPSHVLIGPDELEPLLRALTDFTEPSTN
jgi:hypothetical protein